MSRTIKDTPARVRRNNAAGTGARVKHRCGHHRGLEGACDASSRDERVGDRRTCWTTIPGATDAWDPYAKTARERSESYWEPERGAVRLSLERARKQARVGDIVEDVPVNQHRHGVFGGGWWD